MAEPKMIEIARVIDQVDDHDELPSRPVRVAVDDPRNDYVCLLWVSYPLGVRHCSSIRLVMRCSSQAIRPSRIRHLPDALDTADEAVREGGTTFLERNHSEIVPHWMDDERRILRSGQSDPLENLEALTASAELPRRKQLQQPLSDCHFQDIARLYREALVLKASPSAHIQKHYDRADSTVRQWIAEARKRGLIPATPYGKKRDNEEAPPRVPKEVILVETEPPSDERT